MRLLFRQNPPTTPRFGPRPVGDNLAQLAGVAHGTGGNPVQPTGPADSADKPAGH